MYIQVIEYKKLIIITDCSFITHFVNGGKGPNPANTNGCHALCVIKEKANLGNARKAAHIKYEEINVRQQRTKERKNEPKCLGFTCSVGRDIYECNLLN